MIALFASRFHKSTSGKKKDFSIFFFKKTRMKCSGHFYKKTGEYKGKLKLMEKEEERITVRETYFIP